MRNKFNGCVLWEGHLYGFDEGSKLICMDVADGKRKWSRGHHGISTLMLAGGKLVILSGSGRLVIAEATAKEYTPLAGIKILDGTCRTVPVLSGGKIYARNARGKLVCVEVTESKGEVARR